MRKIIAVCAALSVIACSSPEENAKEMKQTDNSNYQLAFLFTVEGCRVYRFLDKGHYQYITSCKNTKATNNFCQTEGKTVTCYHRDEVKL